jgi:hypothetical protein
MNKLTKGDPLQRTIGNYAKAAPMGAEAPGPSVADLLDMGAPPPGALGTRVR